MLKTESIYKIVTIFAVLILLAGCGQASGPSQPPVEGKYAEVAKCLTAKGAVMYGAYWCPHCQSQKASFGDDVRFIKYQECDPAGPNGDQKVCLEAGVTSYPTWVFPGQGNLPGDQPIFLLAKLANCQDKLPAEDKQKLAEAEKQLDQVAADPAATDPVTIEPVAVEAEPGTTGQPEPVGRTPVTGSEQPTQTVTP